MTISYDASSQGVPAVGSVSWSHVLGSGADRKVVLIHGSENGGTASAIDIATATFNGVSFTPVSSPSDATQIITEGGTRSVNTDIWYIDDASLPATGTYTIAVTLTDAGGIACLGAVSVRGISQGQPEAVAVGGSATDTSPGTPFGTAITTLTNDAWIFEAINGGSAQTFAPAASQTLRVDITESTFSSQAVAGATFLQTAAGAKTCTWDTAALQARWAHTLAAWAPTGVVAATSSPPPSASRRRLPYLVR